MNLKLSLVWVTIFIGAGSWAIGTVIPPKWKNVTLYPPPSIFRFSLSKLSWKINFPVNLKKDFENYFSTDGDSVQQWDSVNSYSKWFKLQISQQNLQIIAKYSASGKGALPTTPQWRPAYVSLEEKFLRRPWDPWDEEEILPIFCRITLSWIFPRESRLLSILRK